MDKETLQKNLVLNDARHARAITRRFVLYVGFKCNFRCQFCYYLKSLEEGTAKNETYEMLARKIKVARFFGKDEIDFTGGEATIHPDFPKLVALSKSLGFKTINVITNGWKLSDKNAFKTFAEAGLNEVLFSFHSHICEVHENLTQIKRSHSKILQAIENAHQLGVRVRINSVVNPVNYEFLNDYMEYVLKLRPHSVNLIVYNPTEETVGYESHKNVRLTTYEEIGKKITEALKVYGDRFPVVNVRFLPFCYAKGGEEHIRTYWQEIYEKQEWDPLLHWAFRKNWFFVFAGTMAGLALSLFAPAHVWFGRKNAYARLAEWFQLARLRYLFVQKKECRQCKLRRICPGLPREFNRKVPEARVFPYVDPEMPEIRNPVFFGYRYPDKFGLSPSKD